MLDSAQPGVRVLGWRPKYLRLAVLKLLLKSREISLAVNTGVPPLSR